MSKILLTVNAGSSSIKFSVYTLNLNLLYRGAIDIREKISIFQVSDTNSKSILHQETNDIDYSGLFKRIFTWLKHLDNKYVLTAVGHRVVHGGVTFKHPVVITTEVIRQIEELRPLAPLHQPHNLNGIQAIKKLYPSILQVACFDTSFHQTQNHLAKQFALPRQLSDEGIIRYGFHGISYEYIALVITEQLGEIGSKKVIIAHLGSGASICAINNKKSVATSMGFTALDGLMMGSRCGNIDPGVILYLIQEKKYTVGQVSDLLYNQSGLLGVSGISSDMRDLVSSASIHASEAIDLFCYRAAVEIGALSIALGGCDAIVFTAGIGENIPQVRQQICGYLSHLGAEIDKKRNLNNERTISTTSSAVLMAVIPTNEEYIIAKYTASLAVANS